MELSGEYRIPAPRERVWHGLNDAATLQASIPGCESLEKISDTEFVARIATRIGPVSARFSGRVVLSDLDPPNGYRISGEGQGGAAGFAKGAARVMLSEDGGGTLLRYEADASVGGKLAQIGSRLVQGAAKKTADDFFLRFSELVGGAATGEAPSPTGPDVQAAPVAGRGGEARVPARAPATAGGLHPAVWIGGLIVVLALLVAWFALAD